MGSNSRDLLDSGRVRPGFLIEADPKTSAKTALLPAVEHLCSEIYNPGSEEITFTTYAPDWQNHFFLGKPPLYWRVLRCKPGEWCFLPHALYIATVPSGSAEIKVVQNFGDAMFRGNKLPSRPDVQKVRSFVK